MPNLGWHSTIQLYVLSDYKLMVTNNYAPALYPTIGAPALPLSPDSLGRLHPPPRSRMPPHGAVGWTARRRCASAVCVETRAVG